MIGATSKLGCTWGDFSRIKASAWCDQHFFVVLSGQNLCYETLRITLRLTPSVFPPLPLLRSRGAALRGGRLTMFRGHLARQAQRRTADGGVLPQQPHPAHRIGQRQRPAADCANRRVHRPEGRFAHRLAQPVAHHFARHRTRLCGQNPRHPLRPQDRLKEVHRLHRR